MIPQSVYLEYLDSLLAGNNTKCKLIVSNLLEKEVDVKIIFTDLLQKAMYRVGKMWELNRLSIADEHLATKITEGLIDHIAIKLPDTELNGKSAVVACIDKEFHELGAKMVAVIFEKNGWQTFYLGANTPSNEIFNQIEIRKPDIIGLSINFYVNILRLLELLEKIYNHDKKQKVLIGGQVIDEKHRDIIKKYKNVKIIESLDELEKILKKK